MKNILVIGAGRSATALINYILGKAARNDWMVTVCDNDLNLAQHKVKDCANAKAAWLDVKQEEDRRQLISQADLVVSLLPAFLHPIVAKDCVDLEKHLVTASYVSAEMQSLNEQAEAKGLIFMNEMGLDPGIDHMSAMQIIHELEKKGAKLNAFRSFTGGLIAPECNDNPWNYKFTWNPRNVVLSGQGTAQYMQDGQMKYIPYNRLFADAEPITIKGIEGYYETYANRDSLPYRHIYGIDNIPTILRGTIRNRGYCAAWNALVKIGLTDSTYTIEHSDEMTYAELLNSYVGDAHKGNNLQERIADLVGTEVDSEVMQKLKWLGLFSDNRIEVANASPALIMEKLLLTKWKLKPQDKDLILMQHQFEYELGGKEYLRTSTLIMKGADNTDTAMARLVGLPMAIFVNLFLEGKVKERGVKIPVISEIYEPVLEELKEYGVQFVEREMEIGVIA